MVRRSSPAHGSFAVVALLSYSLLFCVASPGAAAAVCVGQGPKLSTYNYCRDSDVNGTPEVAGHMRIEGPGSRGASATIAEN